MFLKSPKHIFVVFDCISALFFLDLQPVNLRKTALICSQIHSKLYLLGFRNTLSPRKAGRYCMFSSPLRRLTASNSAMMAANISVERAYIVGSTPRRAEEYTIIARFWSEMDVK